MIRSPLFHVCLLGLAVSCRHLLDINEAEFDPGVASTGGSHSNANGGSESGAGGAEDAPGHAGASSESNGGAPSDGGDSGTSASGGEAGGTGGDPPPPSSLCQTYCAAITANCTGDLAQYTDLEACLAVCDALPEGWDDNGSNTVRCRLEQAEKATSQDAASYFCPQAGPSGGGECGWSCDAYCSVMMAFCTSKSTGGLAYYPSSGACKQACREVPQDDEPYSVSAHSTGPHLQCRLVHACAAAGDPANQCAAALGGSPCQAPE
jgi:hypothetical protein